MLLLTAALLLLCGCEDISDRKLPDTEKTVPKNVIFEPTQTTTAPPTETGIPAPEVFTTTETTESTAFSEEYGTFILSEEDNDFISRCVFVGDSICSGLANYGIVPWRQVAAQGNIAARNIFDFTFTENGAQLSLLSLLVDRKPEYIVFSMGMNDVNITTKQEFAENYRELLRTVEGFLPKAKLIVLSVTPVDAASTFTANENIDNFNAQLKEMVEDNSKWTYVDVTPEMKNPKNGLKTDYGGGDGIHLSPDAYYAILSQLCDAMLRETQT